MRFYVAAKFEEGPRARVLMDRLEALGHMVTHDWTREETTAAQSELMAYAQNAADGVSIAERLVLLWHPKLQGGFIELGIAMAMHGHRPPAVIGAPPDSPCIFFRLCEHFDTIEAFIASLAKRAP